ncbi:hypothetical protein C8R46DRAFT_1344821 [Mycena filopes]|nr:hypothetical protein C8R46DRAFT_1344821 [Mycena filopes]
MPDHRYPSNPTGPPPIPQELHHRECFYGYIVNPDVIDAFILAEDLGFTVAINNFDTYDLVWFSYTKEGRVRLPIPAALILERFEKELGITEKLRWQDYYVLLVFSLEEECRAYATAADWMFLDRRLFYYAGQEIYAPLPIRAAFQQTSAGTLWADWQLPTRKLTFAPDRHSFMSGRRKPVLLFTA